MKKTILKIAVKAAFLSVVLALTGCSGTGGQSSSFSGNNGGNDDSNSSSSSSVSGSDESIIESDVIPTSARQAAGEGNPRGGDNDMPGRIQFDARQGLLSQPSGACQARRIAYYRQVAEGPHWPRDLCRLGLRAAAHHQRLHLRQDVPEQHHHRVDAGARNGFGRGHNAGRTRLQRPE